MSHIKVKNVLKELNLLCMSILRLRIKKKKTHLDRGARGGQLSNTKLEQVIENARFLYQYVMLVWKKIPGSPQFFEERLGAGWEHE